MLDQKPLFLLARHVRTHQVPQAAELLPLQLELEPPLGVGRHRIVQGNPDAPVPDDHLAGAVMSLGNAALERGVRQRMVFDMHRQTLDRRIQRRAFGHGPALERTFELQAKIIMQVRGVMLLNAELQGMIPGGFPAWTLVGGRLGSRRKITHAVVVNKVAGHGSPASRQDVECKCLLIKQSRPAA
ncbi:hypothetical protein D3C76_791920 [compost metagenome]